MRSDHAQPRSRSRVRPQGTRRGRVAVARLVQPLLLARVLALVFTLLPFARPTPARAGGGLLLVAAAAPAHTPLSAPVASTFAVPPPPRETDAHRETRMLQEMAAQGTNTTRLYQLGDVCHDLGVTGDKKAVERAEAYLRQLLALEPTNAPALALLGSVYTMKGRDAFWPTQQLRLVHEGNRYMDQAVGLAPDDIRVRIIRSFNNAHMPDFLGRTDTVRADLAWLLERAARSPDRFSLGERQEIGLHWGRQLRKQKKTEEARKAWETALALGPDTRHGRELARELEKLR